MELVLRDYIFSPAGNEKRFMHVNDYSLVFWMTAWMDDTVHIQVQIVKFYIIWIWLAGVHRDVDIVNFLWLQRQEKLMSI